MKVWITKYALTSGIYVSENAERCNDGIFTISENSFKQWFTEDEYEETWEAAEATAEKMRDRKINSLREESHHVWHVKFENPDKQQQ